MALELQISTQQAQANIEAVNAAIRDFVTVTQQLSRGVENVEKFTAALNTLRPVSAEVITSINGLAQATNSLSAGAANIERFAAAMGAINGGGAAAAAGAINGVARATGTIDGSKLDALAAGMSRAGQAAGSAVNPMTAAMATANNYRTSLDGVAAGMTRAGAASSTTGAHLDVVSRGMTSAGQAAAAGVGNFNNLANAANNAGTAAQTAGGHYSVFRGILQSMVFATVIAGFKSLVDGAMETSTAITNLKIQIDTVTKTAGAGAKSWEHLRETALQLAIPIEALTTTYGRFVTAFTAGGHSLEEAQRVYDNFAITFRAFGLGAGEATRAFIAVDQVFQKGKVQAEELVRQLGQNIPAMELLAKSMGLVDGAGKPLVKMLQDQMKQGKVSSDVFIKFSEDLRTQFGPAVTEAAKTGGAALITLNNGVKLFSATMGDALFAAAAGQMRALGLALAQTGGPLQSLAAGLGYITGGIGAAFLYIVQSWMTYLGTASQIISTAGAALGQLGAYLASLLPSGSRLASVLQNVGAVAGYVIQAFGPFATVLITGAVALGAFSYALGVVRGALAPVGAAIYAALTNPFVQMALVSAVAVAAIVGLGVALYSLRQSIATGTSFTENFKNNMNSIGEFVQGAGSKLLALIPKVNTTGTAFGTIGTNTDAAGTALSGFGGSVDTIKTPVEELKIQAGQAATNVTDVGTAAGGANTNLGKAAGSAGQFAGNLDASAGAAYRAETAYKRAAEAAERYARAIAATGGGGGGGPNGGAKMYYGGVAGKGGVGQTFSNARTYAGGGVTPDVSGGIPSILHANEAVVPLRAGGTIPISLVGTSAPSNNGQQQVSPVTSLLQQIAQDDVTRDALLGQHNDKLDLILGQLTSAFPKATEFYQNSLNVMNSVLGAINGLASSGGGTRGSSGGGGGGSSGGSVGGINTEGLTKEEVFRQTQEKIQELSTQRNNKWEETMISLRRQGASADYKWLQQQYNASDTAQKNMQIDLQAAQLQRAFDEQYGAGAYAKMLSGGRATGLGSAPGFATGSPNASMDASGGFTATLHPDEAVIPLPDGRSVPVSLSADVEANLASLKAMLGASQRVLTSTVASGGGSQTNTTNNNNKVTMIIQTPDADSFRKSQPQIMADLRGQLQRAQQTSGAVKRSTEDPTKRLVWRGQ